MSSTTLQNDMTARDELSKMQVSTFLFSMTSKFVKTCLTGIVDKTFDIRDSQISRTKPSRFVYVQNIRVGMTLNLHIIGSRVALLRIYIE